MLKSPLGWAQRPAPLQPGEWGWGILAGGWQGSRPFCADAQWFAELMGLSLRAWQVRNSPCSCTSPFPWESAWELWLHHFCAQAAHARALGCVWGVTAIGSRAPTENWMKGLGVLRSLLCFWCLSGPWHPLCVPQISAAASEPKLNTYSCASLSALCPIQVSHCSACLVPSLALHLGLSPSLP